MYAFYRKIIKFADRQWKDGINATVTLVFLYSVFSPPKLHVDVFPFTVSNKLINLNKII